ncbi:5,10-methylene-tetrahydrofolate dehydrogenase [Staphylococcus debuckii]|uniref:5,10-methylene-tetrahydrofolate dehydrogenase n=1 Tax=Staphylococcus debuckii TaxID=2044912 RepID=UPI000F4313E9|nr:5,10-methylene-tetrahydrofolate dehydrogenase [Staphylococcus debuckii]AYU54427.1 5,10-methylene-tetrahydrofolate dehydrogenase [Staphylococcus debuckii]
MEQLVVGIVAAPGIANKLSHKMVDALPDLLSKYISSQYKWKIEVIVNALTGSAEEADKAYQKTEDYLDRYNWNYIISLTDLPLFHDNEAVIAVDINEENGASMISIPAYGWRPLTKRLEKTIITVIHEINLQFSDHAKDDNEKDDEERQKEYRNIFPFSNLRKIRTYADETHTMHIRYIVASKISGNLRLLSGMTFANNPLRLMQSMNSVIAIAFTTGASGMIFSTMWQLGNTFTAGRLTVLSLFAIIGMIAWIILAHNLWESTRYSQNRKITRLYNMTTLTTLGTSVLIYYIVLMLLYIIAALILLPSGFLGRQLELKHAAPFSLYIFIAWFAASISTIAGAIGAGMRNEKLVRESTYGSRQQMRKALSKEKSKEQ